MDKFGTKSGGNVDPGTLLNGSPGLTVSIQNLSGVTIDHQVTLHTCPELQSRSRTSKLQIVGLFSKFLHKTDLI